MKSVYTVIIKGNIHSRCKTFQKDFKTWNDAEKYIENEKKAERHKGLLVYDIAETIVEDDYEVS